jgi:hypothetical protein
MIRAVFAARNTQADYMAVLGHGRLAADSVLLASLWARVNVAYGRYGASSPELHLLAQAFDAAHQPALRRCYDLKIPKVRELWKAVIDAQPTGVCQYCGINNVSQVDHYLPRASHPEFSIFNRNLVPTCPPCNSPRPIADASGYRQIIHLYDDPVEHIPPLLRVRVDYPPQIKISLAPHKNRPLALLYQRHFLALKLKPRYERHSIDPLGDLLDEVREARKTESVVQVSGRLRLRARLRARKVGKNDFQASLMRAVARRRFLAALSTGVP